MNYAVFKHPCGRLQAKLGGHFVLPVKWPRPPAECEGCKDLHEWHDGGYLCRADRIGDVSVTTEDIRQYAIAKYRRQQEMEALARTARLEREGME